jgi:hypothetical protein
MGGKLGSQVDIGDDGDPDGCTMNMIELDMFTIIIAFNYPSCPPHQPNGLSLSPANNKDRMAG